MGEKLILQSSPGALRFLLVKVQLSRGCRTHRLRQRSDAALHSCLAAAVVYLNNAAVLTHEIQPGTMHPKVKEVEPVTADCVILA